VIRAGTVGDTPRIFGAFNRDRYLANYFGVRKKRTARGFPTGGGDESMCEGEHALATSGMHYECRGSQPKNTEPCGRIICTHLGRASPELDKGGSSEITPSQARKRRPSSARAGKLEIANTRFGGRGSRRKLHRPRQKTLRRPLLPGRGEGAQQTVLGGSNAEPQPARG